MTAPLPQGLYDLLTTQSFTESKKVLVEAGLSIHAEDLNPEFSHERLANALAEQLSQLLADIKGKDKVETQALLINEILRYSRQRLEQPDESAMLATPPRVIRALYATKPPNMPAIGLAQPWLFTAGKDSPALFHELQAELASCNSVDILMSFITVSGVRKIIDVLKQITSTNAQGQSQARVRILTTTYIGATEQKALDMLARLPNCAVRVSLDGRRTRLHAKAWIFERHSGFGSAYVGSANLSSAALMGGLEWTVKFTEKGQNQLYQRAQAHFETLWQDGEFQPYNPEDKTHRQELANAIKRESGQDVIATPTFFDIEPKPFQQDILEQLANERAHGRMRNLLVAATGTGKTVMAAFDYRTLARQQGGLPRLLFVAHRKELLIQAMRTFRLVLREPDFGDLFTGEYQPTQDNHLFATIQSINARKLVSQTKADHWRMVIMDECHHIEANSFEQLLTTLKPACLLGLTATPERTDGKSILRHFDNRPDGSPAAQLRLWQALDLQLLAPFEYYACDDNTDYRSIPWKDANELKELDKLLTGNHVRAAAVIRSWQQLVNDPRQGKTLVFCVSIAHAEFMAEQFEKAGILASVITGQSSSKERHELPQRLKKGDIHALITVDLYNEGVDLPFVDTLLLLRPTQSATLFQQQIGRGLRLHEGKESCLILDFVGQHKQGFRFDLLYSAITGLTRREVVESVDKGFGRLPSGCHLQLQKQAREHILDSLRQAINQNWRRLQQELHAYVNLTNNRQVTLSEFLNEQQLELEDIYRSGQNSGWTNLKRDAGLLEGETCAQERYFSRRIGSLLHIDDAEQLQLIQQVAEQNAHYLIANENERQRLQMLAYQIDGEHKQTGSAHAFLDRLAQTPAACAELAELSHYLDARTRYAYSPLPGLEHTPLKLHAAYQSREILTAVGFLTEHKRTPFQAGVLPLKELKTELLLVTLDKSAAQHEGVAYHDYAISQQEFHWQSQNSGSPDTPSGRRYLDSSENGWRFQLFVRINKQSPYRACGPVRLLRYHGSKPMNIVWQLEHPLPVRLFREFSVLKG
ncbi:type III restriction protein res subunit [Oceanimonas sp. GK1]|uniref:DUF3427 domain-containing protein n=1 Tax=Oceanimonas sp. (strain GK1 / IBRC-M 10197) TaxID=511062 RepID=UPI000249511B|nr:DUF3427 domain-containing protein [Oceanimonas sp. GK1]AEY02275.1 type III restriction protein res subunit [Oceanimonas sp. GK1]